MSFESINSANSLDNDAVVINRLEAFLEKYHLTPLHRVAVQRFIQKQLSDLSNDRTSRTRRWLLSALNGKSCLAEHPGQIGCPEIIPGLRSMPIWPNDEFPWIQELRDATHVIREELLSLRDVQRGGNAVCGNRTGGLFQPYRAPTWATGQKSDDQLGGKEGTSKGKWNVLYLQLHNQKFVENCEACPVTMDILTRVLPRGYQHCMFSALSPGSHVMPHHGPTNKKLRVHLPLISCKGCRLRVADQIIDLQEGVPYVFDDSFEHEVWHDGDCSRFVLIADIWHPDLTDEEVNFLIVLRNSQLRYERALVTHMESALNESHEKNEELEHALKDNFFSLIDRARNTHVSNRDFWVDSKSIDVNIQ